MFLPIYWLIVTSITEPEHAFSLPPEWFPLHITSASYASSFDLIPFAVQIMNSIEVTTIVVIGQLLTSSLAAYAFARLKFRGRDGLFTVFLVALMVPLQVTVIPIFILMRTLGLLDTQVSLWLPVLLSVFGIFFLRQHFLSLPDELEDAAKIDGAGHWRILFQILLPLSGPILAALAIFSALVTWNDFFWPNIMITSPDKMTVPVGLVFLQAGLSGAPAVVVFAAIATVTIPLLVLFLIAQESIMRGIALAGVSR
jgi:multiple sugar transport system permease protein